MKHYSALLLLYFSFNVFAQHDTLHINQIQVIGSHNSYKKAIEDKLYSFLESQSDKMKSLQYDHISIPEQLNLGLRNLEIDVYLDTEGGKFANPKGLQFAEPKEDFDPNKDMLKPGFKVLHMPDIDFRSHYNTLEACLMAIKSWSDANPTHEPVFITLEAKDGDTNRFGTTPEAFTETSFKNLDNALIAGLGRDKLITPDDVRGEHATLEEAILNNNWPTLKASRGKFLFILDDAKAKRALYIKNHPSLKGRVLFANAEPGSPEAATLIRNNPEDKTISSLVSQGYIIRTRADAGTKEARANDYSHFEAAKKSGAQIITTDYYLPSRFFDSNYHISFKNKGYVRKNPVNATPN
ncbi:phosphatidylinositol-specific phospholipase C1-like protein [Algibacter miyuki]|uniref:Phosphatidylinositol-specific phospholipase C1-like protein n=1 Tax=Algibacter miyuki TaxID=1306933 RepID=A0ABV5GYX2_9FLAO|nr:phosphatidylinositol-specific phospholipase C1-like protein [Algibacter miyuki]MDN3667044.1 phosphatidylinositol-specific phospholipase C1-like protein [Algibacter miyuki]